MSDTSTGGTLDSSVPTPEVVEAGAEQRINALMSKWQTTENQLKTAQSEIERLQTMLASAVSSEDTLKAQLASVESGGSEKLIAVEGRATVAEQKVAELTTELTKTEGELTKLRFLAKNADLGKYGLILPDTTDTAVLEAAAARIREARQSDRQHLSDPLGGGERPRLEAPAMTGAALKAFLETASSPAEGQARLKQAKELLSKR